MNLDQHLPSTLSFRSASNHLADKENIVVLHGHGTRYSERLTDCQEQPLVLEAVETANASAFFFGREAGEPFDNAVSLIAPFEVSKSFHMAGRALSWQ
jgi:hypothetical protein